MTIRANRYRKKRLLMLLLCLLPAFAAQADTQNDFQQWTLWFGNHHLDETWSVSMQVENRLRDDASEVDKQIFKPAGTHRGGGIPEHRIAGGPAPNS
jgi:hypothetical protein